MTRDRGDSDSSIREGGLSALLRRPKSGSPDDARSLAMEHPQMILEQKRDLVKLVEKRFPPGSQIQTDYLQLKLEGNVRDEETWRTCLV